jgi:molecular chaperone DnaK (HSP70)
MARAKFIKPFVYRVLTVDIGAFTTDLSCVEFKVVDGDVDGLERPEVRQESQPIGISDLDKKILKQLGPEAEETFAAKSAKDWEDVKRRLYNGQPAKTRKPEGGVLTLGEGDQAQKIPKTIERFAGKIQSAITEFCEAHGGQIDEAVLTGGGAMISSLREAVTDELRDSVTENILDLLDPEEARRFLYRGTPAAIEARTKTNHQLLRGGSAIGGCSVFVDLPQHEENVVAKEEGGN